MAASKPVARIVDRKHYDQQYLFEIDESKLPTLAPSSVRVQPIMLGLAAYNLSYCALGDMLHWYDAYTVPKQLPSPYNNANQYAVAPGWGYATVKESTIEELKAGTMLYGMLPTSTMLADLELAQSKDDPQRWIEVSERRNAMMELYKHYSVADQDFSSDVNEAFRQWRCGAFVIFQCGYVMNRYVFSAWPLEPVVSPFPGMTPWTAADADLTRSVVITLGSGSKTCRSFVHQVATNRADGRGPVAVVEVTASGRSGIEGIEVPFKHRVADYDEARSPEVSQWIMETGADNVKVLDFGGRGDFLEALTSHLGTTWPQAAVQVMTIGTAPKVYTEEDMKERMAKGAKTQAVRLNTSPIIEALMKEIGQRETHELLINGWRKVVESETVRNAGTTREGQVLGHELDVRKGVKGGLDVAWTQLCEGKTVSNTAVVISL
ncbi:uncharacterized protein HMPREF1541_08834 [Cyphellophora europaea CBS 101466]|uniref:Enoyl reductase (ER) domain-containing protein n=1 Tax=Cyphellophora europaea (strain CBS 101466) TaxID=1220924 RepID=W2RJA7_CYPE1|nr:uncharacterized protein HMPREF1541_08834 [Cyphellophora europaea CBS 101466]ETN36556.1 hypothetical protein HMPREF1541_08834 [Cyphellophora europaea CBS 101466]